METFDVRDDQTLQGSEAALAVCLEESRTDDEGRINPEAGDIDYESKCSTCTMPGCLLSVRIEWPRLDPEHPYAITGSEDGACDIQSKEGLDTTE